MTNLVLAIGTTTDADGTKVRFTADLVTRSKAWSRAGVDADFVTLPSAMPRLEALYLLRDHERFQTPERQRAINEQIVLKEMLIARDERRAKRKARQAGTTTVSLSQIRARKTEVENA